MEISGLTKVLRFEKVPRFFELLRNVLQDSGQKKAGDINIVLIISMLSKTIVNEVRSTILREVITGHKIIIHPLKVWKSSTIF